MSKLVETNVKQYVLNPINGTWHLYNAKQKYLARNKPHKQKIEKRYFSLRFFFLLFVVTFEFFEKLGFGLHNSGSVATATRAVPFSLRFRR